MKQVVITQEGIGEAEYIRKFILEVPDDWDKRDIEAIDVEKLDDECGALEWDFNYRPLTIAVSSQKLSFPGDEDYRLSHVPVLKLCSDLDENYYEQIEMHDRTAAGR